ncbi:MAG TPA: ATP-binding protein [Turneriella sp.]|nr:ATP-binding protein [Turneriella sp.]
MNGFQKKLQRTWIKFVNGGRENFISAQEAKHLRIANQLLISIFFINLWLNVIEIIAYVFMMRYSAELYRFYLVAYAIPSVILYIATAITYYFINRSGNMNWSFFILPVVVIYIGLLNYFLGPNLMIHLFMFLLLPIPFFLYETRDWKNIVIQECMIVLGIAFIFYAQAILTPPYSVPSFLEKPLAIAAVVTAIAVMLLVAGVMWKQTSVAENQLAIEKEHVETLLGETIPKLERAEEKYRNLVEGTGDIVFSMKSTGEIITINRAVKTHLGFNPQELVGASIFSLFPDSSQKGLELEADFFRENLRELLENHKPVTSRVIFSGKYAREPVEFSLRMECIETHGDLEILGKAVSVQDDLMIQFLHREKGSYSIGNFINHADVLSQKLTRNLKKYLHPTDVQTLRVSLREILINAIEHGNLAITFDEKSAAQMNGDFLEFLASRRVNPQYENKKVKVDYYMDARRIAYRIHDDGDGFDHGAMMQKATDIANEDFLAHGRGISMTREFFDIVRYNEKGNEVVLIKYTDKSKGESNLLQIA